MRSIVLCSLALLAFVIPAELEAVESDWLSAPKPNFPPSALRKGSEGSVKLKVLLARDGSVTSVRVMKTSGDSVLDETARSAVLKWKLRSSAVRPSDLTKGRNETIEFRQEAVVAAVYPDRKASFESWEHTEWWMYAPFPSYPLSERRLRHTGIVLLYGRIVEDGHVADIRILQSSGYPELDRCAVAALRLWRAHKKYAGTQFKLPIRFHIGR
jgi:TonB family protein